MLKMFLSVCHLLLLICCISSGFAEEQWFEQTLDHFDHENHRTWSQRYFVSDKYYTPGGPAFLQIGGEGPAGPVWLDQGHWIEIAKEVGAKCFILEHRFYGESHPTNDTSVENLQFLSSEQALADIARFITNKTVTSGLKTWITFGGSYPGSLSLWMKLKYPHLIKGAMSASAPLLAKMDFFEYNEVVNRSLSKFGSPKCVENIAIATKAVDTMLQSDTGRQQLMKLFNLCSPLSADDYEYFQNAVADSIAETVQYNRDNRAFEGATDGNVTISVLCDHMTDQSLGSEIDRYATIPSLFGNAVDRKRVFSRRYRTYGNEMDKCFDASYANFIQSMKTPTFDAGRTWTFQTCTEFGWFQSTDSSKQPFRGFPVGLFTDICIKVFGSSFNPTNIQNSIMETNANYGARDVASQITNAVLFNGGVDPWHAMSYTTPTDSSPYRKIVARFNKANYTNHSPTFHTLFVPSSAHCAIMYPDKPEDPPELRYARAQASKYVKSWLK
uniref:putative serine protease K12H4.7 n=1 Tax=Styela clava TaxID=7725 RepID=UPI001939EA87|nr:putative serine protease K12H4.7 [Styela clava]